VSSVGVVGLVGSWSAGGPCGGGYKVSTVQAASLFAALHELGLRELLLLLLLLVVVVVCVRVVLPLVCVLVCGGPLPLLLLSVCVWCVGCGVRVVLLSVCVGCVRCGVCVVLLLWVCVGCGVCVVLVGEGGLLGVGGRTDGEQACSSRQAMWWRIICVCVSCVCVCVCV